MSNKTKTFELFFALNQQQNKIKRREGQVFSSTTNEKGGKMRIFWFSCENETLYNQTNPTSACF
jgi:hypothetical protein